MEKWDWMKIALITPFITILSQLLTRLHNSINHIPRIAAIIRQVCTVSTPLQFIEFHNNNRYFLALLDSGAQLNVINTKLLSTLKYHPTDHHPSFTTLQGVQGKSSTIQEWVEITISLSNGQTEQVIFAAINDFPNGIILGLPFLTKTGAVVDYANGVLTTIHGPICLTSFKKSRNAVHVIETPKLALQGLTNKQEKKLYKILNKYAAVWRNNRRGITTEVKHQIFLSTNIPINCRPRRHTPHEQQAIDKEIEKMLGENVIRPSASPYASEIVLVQKPNGEWRVCIDYRQLNAVTIPDRYPIPRISDLLYRIQNSQYFIVIDLRAGYWQVPMHPDSIKYTAFRCFRGLFEFLVMPFGLCNAPASFQRLMNALLGKLYFHGVVIYLDDILIHGTTIEEVLSKFEIVMERLDKAGLTINLQKCKFFPTKLLYLGHIIEGCHMYPNPSRVQALYEIKSPTTVHDIRVILGCIGYYQQYIKGYSSILAPIFELLKATKNTTRKNKLTPITWTESHNEALNMAISILAEATLKIPMDTSDFLLETDASDISVGAILNCLDSKGDWAPVEFASKKLSETQRRWPTREKEAFAIIFGLQKFDHFLRGRTFRVHTDHESLQWMQEAKTGKIARWASRMTEFDMQIYYKKGSEMGHVDFMSRYIDSGQDIDFQDRMVLTMTASKPLPTIEDIVNEQKVVLPPVGKGYFLREGKWYFRNGLWVPTRLRLQILAACHSLSPCGHPGSKKTKRMINRIFNWPNLHQDVANYIKGCLICQQSRPGLERLQGFFRTHPIPGPFQTLYIDYWSCEYGGHHIVLTILDQFTKWVEAVPIPDRSGHVVTSAFIRSWICRFGVPRTIITDNDKTFMSEMFQGIAIRLGIKTLRTTVYHPEGNAPVESFHRTLRKRLTQLQMTNGQTIPFNEALQLVLMSYRMTVHTTTGETPGFLTYGVDLRPAIEGDWRYANKPSEEARIQYLNNLRLDVQFQATRLLEKRNQNENQDRLLTELTPGVLVLIRNTPHDLIQLSAKLGGRKLAPRWSSPCRVIRVGSGGKRAIVRNLISFTTKEIHLQDVRSIAIPQGDTQRIEWEAVLLEGELSLFDPGQQKEILRRFWDEIEAPQSAPGVSERKRPRISEGSMGAS